MTHERMHGKHFASELVKWLDVVALNAVYTNDVIALNFSQKPQ